MPGDVHTQGKKAVPQTVYSQDGRQKTDENRHNVDEYEETMRGQRSILRLVLGIKIPLQNGLGCEYKNTLGLTKRTKN